MSNISIEYFKVVLAKAHHIVNFQNLTEKACQVYQCQGVLEEDLNEVELDEILKEKSYSGGNLPTEAMELIEQSTQLQNGNWQFFFIDRTHAEGFLQHIGNLGLSGELCVEKNDDWAQTWKDHYREEIIADTFLVVPHFLAHLQDTAAYQHLLPIIIHPAMAFGTGSHPTTQMCLQLLATIPLTPGLILDLGTGSGILSIGALRVLESREQTAQVLAVDVDPEALSNATLNITYNSSEVQLITAFARDLPQWKPITDAGCQLICANILLDTLMSYAPFIISSLAPGGILILSGILRSQANDILNIYLPHLQLLKHLEQDDWAALAFKKNL